MPKQKIDPSREHALKIIRRTETTLSFPKLLVEDSSEKNPLDRRQRAFTYQLVMGTLRYRGTLDWFLEKTCNTSIDELTPWIRNILRMGLYQILYLDRVPKSAAVNESVKLAKKYGHSGTAGLVNAVLRNAKREVFSEKFDVLDDLTVQDISVKYSHPPWMVGLFIADWGRERALEIMRYNNEIPPLVARTNTLRATREELIQQLKDEEVDASCLPQVEEAIELHTTSSPASLQAYRCGHLYFQDSSSMLAAHCLDAKPGQRILDVCAGPGGKATHIAALMKNSGAVYAIDIHGHRIALIEKNAQRLGVAIIETRRQDATTGLVEQYKEMDGAIVDAPCSGIGGLRRRLDLKWRLRPDQIEELVRLQAKLLSNAAECVRPGGILLYCTCTVTRRENLGIVERFVDDHPGYSVDSEFPIQLREYSTKEGFVQIMPGNENMEGFFIARFRRF